MLERKDAPPNGFQTMLPATARPQRICASLRAPTVSDPASERELRIAPVGSDLFLALVRRHGRVAGGPIVSQYESELRNGAPQVGAYGLFACGRLVGALSYGRIDLPEPKTFSGRIDVVVTEPHCRGRGVAGLLLADLLRRLLAETCPRLRHLSVIAESPSIAAYAERFGMKRQERVAAPLYSLRLDEAARRHLERAADETFANALRSLRLGCVACRRRAWGDAWCRPDGKPGS